MKEMIKGKYIWACVDETTDKTGRYIANLIIGVLDGKPQKPFLLAVKFLTNTAHQTIARFVNDTLREFIPTGKLLLFVTDAAQHMIKAVEGLKFFYPNVVHLTCLCRALNGVVESFIPEEAEAIGAAQMQFFDPGQAHFMDLPNAIKELESQGMPVVQSLEIVAKIRNDFDHMSGPIGDQIRKKMKAVFHSNPGFDTISRIALILSGGYTDYIELPPDAIASFKYAPIHTCNVERYFPSYKMISADNRSRFTPENLEMHLICYCNE